ncbi:hypothetical protein GWI33_003651 [Rhynchophorus ferrugineus]|uniref:Gustatory receptor n=1 Tax=Rhynchophorus ferrugineus TaxID=354439 RepID=A0A834HK76_RHYFE|nr:hypothetical protein GWI33_003651 [Rhynchophorus ferrugineus]
MDDFKTIFHDANVAFDKMVIFHEFSGIIKMIEAFNNIFALQLLILFWYLIYSITSMVGSIYLYYKADAEVYLVPLRTLHYLVLMTLIMTFCTRITTKLSRVGVICKKLMSVLKQDSSDMNNTLLLRKFTVLVNMLDSRQPHFNTLGFLDFNYGAYSIIFNASVSCILIFYT